MPESLESTENLPRVILRKRRAQPFFCRHPWVFSGAIERIEGQPEPGDEVLLVTDRNEFVARGLFNPASKIQVRLYSWDERVPLDETFWRQRFEAAIQLRRQMGLLPETSRSAAGDTTEEPTQACRLVFSESDGLSGLVVDWYAGWLLTQFTSLALAARRELFATILNDLLHPRGIWLRTEKGMREAEGLELRDGQLSGETPPRPLSIHEHGLRYSVDVVEGQKTGFFIDQRDNRSALAPFVRDRRVLDLFCYSGGFALNAARFGARDVLALDSSEPALTLARANAEANGFSDRIQFQKSDIFKGLEQLRDQGEKFGVVILDPPKMARHGHAVPEALKGYHWLNSLAMQVLEPNGILVTCSCSGHLERSEFEAMLAEAALTARRRVQILAIRGAGPDHPTSVHCLETGYLKCYICRVE